MTPIFNPLEPQDGTPRQGWTPLLDALPQGVVLVDAEGRYLEVNPAAAEILGLDRETLLSFSLPEPWASLSAPDGSALSPEDFPGLMAMRTGTPVRRRTLGWKREDGSTLWLRVSAAPLQGGGALVSYEQMDEHPSQSRKLERQAELYSALSQVNQAIVWSPTREALLDKMCQVMVEFGKFKLAWIGWDDPETHQVRIISQYGDTHGYLHGLQVRSDDTPLGKGGIGIAVREGRTYVINDFLGAPEASPWHESAIRSGVAASASIPIRYGGKVCGALTVYAAERNFFGSQEIGLLEEAAGDVAYSLDMHDLQARRKEAEKALKESEFFFRESQRAAAIGSYKTDFIEGRWESSEVLDSIFGIARSYDRSIQGWLDIVHPDDQAMMDQYLRDEVIAGRRAFLKEYRIIRKVDGVTRWVQGRGEIKFDEGGHALSLIGTIQDITDRKGAEDALHKEKTFTRALLDNQIEGVVACDGNGELVLFNRTLVKWQGMDALDLPQEQWAEHYDLCEADGMTPLATHAIPLVRAFNGEAIHGVGLVICAKNQPPRYVLCNGSPILDETHQKLGAVVVMHDITQQRKDSDRLQSTLQRLELATTSAKMGVWDWDLQAGTMIWDDRMFELYGASRGEILGTVQDWKDGLHPQDLGRAIEECDAAIRGDAPFNSEFRVKHKDGTVLWIKANALVLRDQDGQPVRMIGLNQDITEQRRAKDEVHRLNQDLEQRVKERTAQLEVSNKEMEAFSYSVSHDLRTPLRSIDGFSQILLEDYQDRLDEEGRRHLSRIRLGAQRMGQIIDDLLRLSRIDRTELRQVDLDLSDLCRVVVNDLMQTHPERKVEVSLRPGMSVKADCDLLKAALENLIGNAWKFTSKSENARIEVGELASTPGARTFFIQDNGAGFDMAFAHKLFDAFQRLHGTREFEGTGIGLAIVQRIIHRHGGRIWAEAEPGKGATFFFALPDSIGS